MNNPSVYPCLDSANEEILTVDKETTSEYVVPVKTLTNRMLVLKFDVSDLVDVIKRFPYHGPTQ